MSTKTYLYHELSSYFPLMEGEEFDNLVDDIRKRGQLEIGVLFEGKILDGRNRYRACKIIGISFKAEEYKGRMDPLDYIISMNLHRRHLTIAQRAEIGLLLLEREERLAQERMKEIGNLRTKKGKEGFTIDVNLSQQLDTKKYGERGKSAKKVAPKLKISDSTLSKAKKIKKIARTDKKIAKEWERAKKGETGVDSVYEQVRDIEITEKLPEPLKKEVEKKIFTPREAKKIEDSLIDKEPQKLKEAIDMVKKEKKEHERTMEYIDGVIKEEIKKPTKFYKDFSQKTIKKFKEIAKQIVITMTMSNIKKHDEETQGVLKKIMITCLEHLQKELKIKEVIEIETNK